MLRLSFILLFCFMSTTDFAIVSPDEKVLSEVVDCGNVSQIELFRRVRLAVHQAKPDNKTLLEDKETGDFVSKGPLAVYLPRTDNSPGGSYQFVYVLSVECVNRKYRASIGSIEFLDNGRYVTTKTFGLKSEKDIQAIQTELDNKLKEILAELQQNVKDYKPF